MAKAQKKAKEETSSVLSETAVDQVADEAGSPAELEPVQLTISDLQQVSRIVDLASRRGAFQAGELSQVGAVFNKLSAFLTYVQTMQEKQEKEESSEATEETTA
jgi:hypothetical protein